jgi:phosphatidylserine decarboxylase
MAVVLVGAMIVASIETVWAGLVTPPKRELKTFRYDEASRAPIHLEKVPNWAASSWARPPSCCSGRSR